GIIVDKHSSGGVGDIVSLIAVPLAAACGARVAKLSGRALGHTGGTIDKLESIPGFRADLSIDEFVEQVQRVGCAIAMQTEGLAPADKRIYHLRDRTATVPSIGLITSSILCKKIAGGAHAFVFDIKMGAASFIREPERAHELASRLIRIAHRFDRQADAFITDMNQPLGRSIGTAIEVMEARDSLRGSCDVRVRELVLEIAAALVGQAGFEDSRERVHAAFESGAGYEQFIALVTAQGGDVAALERMRPRSARALRAASGGFLKGMDVAALGHAARVMSAHDPLSGLRVNARIGDWVDQGAPLLFVHGAGDTPLEQFTLAFALGEEPVTPPPVMYERF
ncbi:MAG TPA: thymidine phosphorylase, partial [Candidatus Baltobacteraceae bacterium]|nr:thymidine phosphorylase [Candidatus Baltobacteraceae bacterium]